MKRDKKFLFVGLLFIFCFVLWTALISIIDKKAIGPLLTSVGFATLNGAFHEITGVNIGLYNVTDWLSIVPIIFIIGFGIVGLLQCIKRKSVLKVDGSILVLGVFYALVFGVYVFFECCVINYRPVLINGTLEPSYPSSTTMLAMCVLLTAMGQFRRLIKNRVLRISVNSFCGLFTGFMVVGRLVCGVHWFTDILGGVLFSSAIVLINSAVNNFLLEWNYRVSEIRQS